MNSQITILILSSVILGQFITNSILVYQLKKIKKVSEVLQDEIKTSEEFLPGHQVTFEQDLQWELPNSNQVKSPGNTLHKFKILYEATVIEVTDKKIKVSAYDFSSLERLPADVLSYPSYKTGLINFMQNKWEEREKLSLVMNKTAVRDRKINEVLK